MRITLKHYVCLESYGANLGNNLISPVAWDSIRNTGLDNPFTIPVSRKAWIEKCQSYQQYSAIADCIVKRADEFGIKSIISHGVGCGYLEFWLNSRNQNLKINCYDYAEQAICKLNDVFLEAEAVGLFNMKDVVWPSAPEAFTLLFRVSTEFDNDQWQLIFSNMHNCGIERVCFIPTEILDFKKGLMEKIRLLYWKLTGSKISFAGYLRTKSVFEDFWKGFYQVETMDTVNDHCVFFLKRIS